MTPDNFLRTAIEPGLGLLPIAMRSFEAKAMLVATALQESEIARRRQFAGPARSYWQFELTGVEAVLSHHDTWSHAQSTCAALDLLKTPPAIYLALEYHDVLACVFARLLLWSHPDALPSRSEPDEGWRQYLALWRPGRPRRERWDANFLDAWGIVQPWGAHAGI